MEKVCLNEMWEFKRETINRLNHLNLDVVVLGHPIDTENNLIKRY
jgi:hypothetical protein